MRTSPPSCNKKSPGEGECGQMIVLSNCLTDRADEGCLKVAVSLVEQIKNIRPETTVIGYECESRLCDVQLSLNKLLLSPRLWKHLRKGKEPVLFLPFSAKMRSTALRTLCVAAFARGPVYLLQPMYSPMGGLSRLLLQLSRAKLITLSRCSCESYRQQLGDRALYLRAGVDTGRFTPCRKEEKQRLREKYGIPGDQPVILHVGHLKAGRNVARLQRLPRDYRALLVVSTHRADQQDNQLRAQLQSQSNLTLIDRFIPDMEEIYRLADVYFFPVEDGKSCIDVPLSALEAAACGIPVVATPFRELKQLLQQPGFYEITSFDEPCLNALIGRALKENSDPRSAVLAYDWDRAAQQLLETMGGDGI